MGKKVAEVIRRLKRLMQMIVRYELEILIVSLTILLFLGGIARVYLTMSEVERKLQEVSVEA